MNPQYSATIRQGLRRLTVIERQVKRSAVLQDKFLWTSDQRQRLPEATIASHVVKRTVSLADNRFYPDDWSQSYTTWLRDIEAHTAVKRNRRIAKQEDEHRMLLLLRQIHTIPVWNVSDQHMRQIVVDDPSIRWTDLETRHNVRRMLVQEREAEREVKREEKKARKLATTAKRAQRKAKRADQRKKRIEAKRAAIEAARADDTTSIEYILRSPDPLPLDMIADYAEFLALPSYAHDNHRRAVEAYQSGKVQFDVNDALTQTGI